jgi:hypothetical protein
MSSQPFGSHQPAAGDIGRRRIDDPAGFYRAAP